MSWISKSFLVRHKGFKVRATASLEHNHKNPSEHNHEIHQSTNHKNPPEHNHETIKPHQSDLTIKPSQQRSERRERERDSERGATASDLGPWDGWVERMRAWWWVIWERRSDLGKKKRHGLRVIWESEWELSDLGERQRHGVRERKKWLFNRWDE